MALKLGKCRLCLKLGDFFSIFSVDSSLQLSEMAMACAQIKICEGDGLPDKVCGECVEKLSCAFIFKQQCERSDQELRRNYIPPPGFCQTPPPPNRQSSDSGFSNRTEVSNPSKNTSKDESQPSASSSPGSIRKRKRGSPERKNKSLLQESFSIMESPADSDYSRPKTPDKRPRYDQDSDYEYPSMDTYDSDDSNNIHKCDDCERVFSSKKGLALHRRTHTKEKGSASASPDKKYANMSADVVVDIPAMEVPSVAVNNELTCSKCDKSFKLQIMLKRHSENCAGKTQTNTGTPKQTKLLPQTNDSDQLTNMAVCCMYCDKTYCDYYKYVAHFNACPKRKETNKFECRHCPAMFKHRGNFLKHLREKHFLSTTGVEPEIPQEFQCRICNKKLASQELLVTHLAAHMSNIDDESTGHTGGEDSVGTHDELASVSSEANGKSNSPLPKKQCQYCDKSFAYAKSLQSHIVAKHSNSQPAAENSEQTVAKNSNPQPVAKHSSPQVDKPVDVKIEYEEPPDSDDDNFFGEGETDNTCDVCEKHFSYRKSLLAHKAKKHPMTSGTKFSKVKFNKCTVKCLLCDVTMSASEIKPHNEVHINANLRPKNIFTCCECAKTFKGSIAMREHIKFVHRLGRAEPIKPSQYRVTDLANFCEVVVTKAEPVDSVQGRNDLTSVPGRVIDGKKLVVAAAGFECHICDKKMATLLAHRRHMAWHSKLGGRIPVTNVHCDICNADFRFKGHYKKHMKTHYFDTNLDPKFLTCAICSRKSKHLFGALHHAKWHKQTRFSNAEEYKCSICKRVFALRKVYLNHMTKHRSRGEGLAIIGSEEAPRISIGAEEHKCHLCPKVCDSLTSLKSHTAWHTSKTALFGTRYDCEICGTVFTNKRTHELHIRSHYEAEDGPHKCPICGKGYTHAGYLKRHVQGHNFDSRNTKKNKDLKAKLKEKLLNKVQCPVCVRFFPDLLFLMRHIKRSHPQSKLVKADPDAPPPKMYHCKMCAKVFVDEKKFQFHEEAHLRKPVHYICKFCGYKTIAWRNHNIHVKGHLTKKYFDNPLQCYRCEEKFVHGYKLHHHLRDVHGIKETWAAERPIERPIGPLLELQCSLCYKVLTSRNYYSIHLDYHNTLRCNYCFEYFNKSIFLDGHLAFSCEKRRLIGDTEVHPRRLKCDICWKAFDLQVRLDCHMWTQHEVREFERSVRRRTEHVCDFCFRVFDNEDTLTRHKGCHRTVAVYGCRYCSRKFTAIVQYNRHKSQHLTSMCEEPIKCDHCDEKFVWFRDMIQHKRDAHGDDSEWLVMPKQAVEEECHICHKRFYNVRRHQLYHEENRCRKCRQYFYSRPDFDKHVCHIESDDEPEADRVDDRIEYKECGFCFKQTSSKMTQMKHDKLHSFSSNISCRLCPLKFKMMSAYTVHAYSHHSRKHRKNPLKCPTCDQLFVKYSPFLKHIKEHGIGKKMYYRANATPEPCVVCGGSFPNVHNHYRAHLANRCRGCLKYFTSQRLYEAHVCDKEDADPSKVFTSDADLDELIRKYVVKDDVEIKYYCEAVEEPDVSIEDKKPPELASKMTFSKMAPVISEVTSLKPAKENGDADSDDDCVIVMTENPKPRALPDTICLDD